VPVAGDRSGRRIQVDQDLHGNRANGLGFRIVAAADGLLGYCVGVPWLNNSSFPPSQELTVCIPKGKHKSGTHRSPLYKRSRRGHEAGNRIQETGHIGDA
jgi:hypothetical protein